jgi:hypothetical protein
VYDQYELTKSLYYVAIVQTILLVIAIGFLWAIFNALTRKK